MAITYAPLREILRERKISYRRLREEPLNIHSRITKRLKNDSGYVTLESIDLLCKFLNVEVQDIMKYVED